jgi:hypothetical protein
MTKINSQGGERFIAKMHLNQLDEIFGRRLDLLETINNYKSDLEAYLGTRVIKTIVPINDNIITLLMHKKIKEELIVSLNSELNIKLSNYYNLMRANDEIACAVTLLCNNNQQDKV